MLSFETVKEHLKTLNIDNTENITKRYVTTKYKRLAKTTHPDKEGGTTTSLKS